MSFRFAEEDQLVTLTLGEGQKLAVTFNVLSVAALLLQYLHNVAASSLCSREGAQEEESAGAGAASHSCATDTSASHSSSIISEPQTCRQVSGATAVQGSSSSSVHAEAEPGSTAGLPANGQFIALPAEVGPLLLLLQVLGVPLPIGQQVLSQSPQAGDTPGHLHSFPTQSLLESDRPSHDFRTSAFTVVESSAEADAFASVFCDSPLVGEADASTTDTTPALEPTPQFSAVLIPPRPYDPSCSDTPTIVHIAPLTSYQDVSNTLSASAIHAPDAVCANVEETVELPHSPLWPAEACCVSPPASLPDTHSAVVTSPPTSSPPASCPPAASPRASLLSADASPSSPVQSSPAIADFAPLEEITFLPDFPFIIPPPAEFCDESDPVYSALQEDETTQQEAVKKEGHFPQIETAAAQQESFELPDLNDEPPKKRGRKRKTQSHEPVCGESSLPGGATSAGRGKKPRGRPRKAVTPASTEVGQGVTAATPTKTRGKLRKVVKTPQKGESLDADNGAKPNDVWPGITPRGRSTKVPTSSPPVIAKSPARQGRSQESSVARCKSQPTSPAPQWVESDHEEEEEREEEEEEEDEKGNLPPLPAGVVPCVLVRGQYLPLALAHKMQSE